MIARGVSLSTALYCLVGLCWIPAPARAGSSIAQQVWTTIPDVVVGGEPGSATALARLSNVKVDASGTRIVVRQSQRVTVWLTDGSQEPLLEFGRRTATPPFGSPRGAYLDSTRLWIRYDDGWGHFAHDGRLVGLTPHPPDEWQRTAILGDGSFLARGRLPSAYRALDEGHPAWKIAVAHVRYVEGSWIADTLLMYDSWGDDFAVDLDGNLALSSQPFADNDLIYFNSRYDAAGLVQRRGGAGEVRVVEIMPGNDTVFDARVPVRPVLLERERSEAAIEIKTREVQRMSRQFRGDTLSTSAVRAIVQEALYIPGQLPLVTAVVPTVSNEVWLRTSEEMDSGTVVWYVLDRTDIDAAPRQVLLPDWFRLRDANRDHVWGLRVDARRSGQVQGRRLVHRP